MLSELQMMNTIEYRVDCQVLILSLLYGVQDLSMFVGCAASIIGRRASVYI